MTTSLKTIEVFKMEFKQYFDTFLEEYPSGDKHFNLRLAHGLSEQDKRRAPISELLYETHKIYQQAITCQSLSLGLGKEAFARLELLGLCKLLQFDNVIDWHRWYFDKYDRNVPVTIYIAIYLRVISEIKRITIAIEKELLESYLSSSNEYFLVNHEKYKDLAQEDIQHKPDNVEENTRKDSVSEVNRVETTVLTSINNVYNGESEGQLKAKISTGADVLNILSHISKFLKLGGI